MRRAPNWWFSRGPDTRSWIGEIRKLYRASLMGLLQSRKRPTVMSNPARWEFSVRGGLGHVANSIPPVRHNLPARFLVALLVVAFGGCAARWAAG